MTNNISKYAWDSIYSFLQNVGGLHVKDEERTRCFVEGVWYVLRTGCQWRLLPTYYGDWRRTHKRYKHWADKGYDSQALIVTLESQDCSAVIPSKINAKNPRKIDFWHYKERLLVEAFFSKMKHFRRVFSRFDKTVSAFLGFLHFVGALIWLR